jgi:hypothetical protein
MMRKARLLPGLFLIALAPALLFVLSGAGTHMSPLLLYPFASPWWMLLPYVESRDVMRESSPLLGGDAARLLAGFTINVAILAVLGFLWDRRVETKARRRQHS